MFQLRLNRRIVLCAAFALLSQVAAHAMAQTLDQAFFTLQTALGGLDEKTGKATMSASDEAIISNLKEKVNAIQLQAGDLNNEEKKLYARSLIHDARLVTEASASNQASDAKKILADVQADLDLKSAARAGMGMASRFNGSVSISVNTIRDNKQVSGYVVALNPLRYKGSTPFIRFPRTSSPVAGVAPPGRYEMIALLDGHAVRSEVVDIGLAAQDSVTIDFPVP